MNFISEYALDHRKIKAYQLDNGLRVIVFSDPSAPIFAYQTWFNVGSKHEKTGKTGIAHLFEHLMFNESENLKPGEFDRMLELKGGHINAATWVDWTYYQNDLPSSELELAVRLEAERMAHLVLHQPQLESEREVVINERRFRVDDDVDGFMSEELFRLAFEKHPYHWPTIGWLADIRAITTEDAIEFYRTYYAPNNATIVIVGDVDVDQTLAFIEKYYGHLKSQNLPNENFISEPAQTSSRRITHRKPVSNEKLLLAYKAPRFIEDEHLHLQIIADVLAGGASSKLYQELIIHLEIASNLQISVTPFKDPGLFEISVSLKQGFTVEDAEAVILRQIKHIQEHGITQEELERSKARFLMHFYSGLRSVRGRAEALGEYQTIVGDYRELFAIPEKLKAVTLEKIKQAALLYLTVEKSTSVIVKPLEVK